MIRAETKHGKLFKQLIHLFAEVTGAVGAANSIGGGEDSDKDSQKTDILYILKNGLYLQVTGHDKAVILHMSLDSSFWTRFDTNDTGEAQTTGIQLKKLDKLLNVFSSDNESLKIICRQAEATSQQSTALNDIIFQQAQPGGSSGSFVPTTKTVQYYTRPVHENLCEQKLDLSKGCTDWAIVLIVTDLHRQREFVDTLLKASQIDTAFTLSWSIQDRQQLLFHSFYNTSAAPADSKSPAALAGPKGTESLPAPLFTATLPFDCTDGLKLRTSKHRTAFHQSFSSQYIKPFLQFLQTAQAAQAASSTTAVTAPSTLALVLSEGRPLCFQYELPTKSGRLEFYLAPLL